jgi:hypothetical protein
VGARRHNHGGIDRAGGLRRNGIINAAKYIVERECYPDSHSHSIGEHQACGICPETDSTAIASRREKGAASATQSRATTSYGRSPASRYNGRLLPDQQ